MPATMLPAICSPRMSQASTGASAPSSTQSSPCRKASCMAASFSSLGGCPVTAFVMGAIISL